MLVETAARTVPAWAADFLTWLGNQPDPVIWLQVQIERDGGTFTLCHADDDPDDNLTPVDGPEALHALARHTAEGDYRPLPTEPTLRRGWVAKGLDEAGLVAALEALYPGCLAVWHAERTGDMRVVPWSGVARRQTGWQGLVKRLDDDTVRAAVAARCGDGHGCLRRVAWGLSDDEPPDLDRGDGAVPCYEACSLLVSFLKTVSQVRRGDKDAPEGDPLWNRFEAAGGSAE